MRPASSLVVLALASAGGPLIAGAQVNSPRHVRVSCSCTDPTARAFAEAVRDAVARNPRYRDVTLTSGTERDLVRLSIVSLPLGGGSHADAPATALSIVFLKDGVMLDHLVETCDQTSVDACARTTVATFDSVMTTR